MKWLLDWKLSRKFTVGGVVALLAIAGFIFLLARALTDQIVIAEKERRGLPYHAALVGVLKATQQHRGATKAATGNPPASTTAILMISS